MRHKVTEATYNAVTIGDDPNNEYEPVDDRFIVSSSVYEVTSPDTHYELLSPSENRGYLCPTPVHASSPRSEYDTVPAAGPFVEMQHGGTGRYINTQSPYGITEAFD